MRLRILALAAASACLLSMTTTARADLTQVYCGGLGQRPCVVTDEAWLAGGLKVNGCDRGLYTEWIGYCRKRASWWPHPCIEFQYPWACNEFGKNYSSPWARLNWLGADWPTEWGVQAYLKQLELGRNEPINWVTQIGTHNAYNNASDASGLSYNIATNQVHSLTEQLEVGSRAIYLDLHQAWCGAFGLYLKLSHQPEPSLGGFCVDRSFVYALRELREWLVKHPQEVIVLGFEKYVDPGDIWFGGDSIAAKKEFRDAIEKELGRYLLRKEEKRVLAQGAETGPSLKRWPTRNQMIAIGRQVVVCDDMDEEFFIAVDECGVEGSSKKAKHLAGKDYQVEREPLIAFQSAGYFTKVEEDSIQTLAYDSCRHEEGAGLICPTEETCAKEYDPDDELQVGPDYCPMDRVVSIDTVRKMAFSIVSLDQLWGATHRPGEFLWDYWGVPYGFIWNWPSSVWGWQEDNKAAAMNRETGYWYAADPSERKPFACSHSRDGSNPSDWLDKSPRTVWKVTTGLGTWEDGGRICSDEFGGEALVFSVPVNVLQNEDLHDLAGPIADVWLAYRDIESGAGVNWQIDRAPYAPTIRHQPSIALEGQRVDFESDWPSACASGTTGTWDFGDGTAPSSGGGISTSGMTRFATSHVFADNGVYQVTHGVTECDPAPHSLSLRIANVPPSLRVDCSAWDECPDDESQAERLYFVGDPVELEAAIHDPGIRDTHSATVDWGDGAAGPMSVSYGIPDQTGIFATLHAEHQYSTCGSFSIAVEARDKDGGVASKMVAVQVDDPPPEISCPADAVAEATSRNGAVVVLGEPVVTGGVCEGIDLSNDGAGSNPYPLGTTAVTWTATNRDESFDTESSSFVHLKATCTQQVTVRDTSSPRIESISASPNVLWPPNKAMRRVEVTVVATDLVDPSPMCEISDVQVYEAVSRGKEGEVPWRIVEALTLDLLAWREGDGGGRTYAATVTCRDSFGNASQGRAEVRVPHDQR